MPLCPFKNTLASLQELEVIKVIRWERDVVRVLRARQVPKLPPPPMTAGGKWRLLSWSH